MRGARSRARASSCLGVFEARGWSSASNIYITPTNFEWACFNPVQISRTLVYIMLIKRLNVFYDIALIVATCNDRTFTTNDQWRLLTAKCIFKTLLLTITKAKEMWKHVQHVVCTSKDVAVEWKSCMQYGFVKFNIIFILYTFFHSFILSFFHFCVCAHGSKWGWYCQRVSSDRGA